MKNNNKFYQLNKELLRISKLKGKSDAILLYTAMTDLLQLSKKSGNQYKNANGDYFVRYTEERALIELGMSDYKFKQSKKLLREIGLIYWDGQKARTAGCSIDIYVKENISYLCDIEELTYNTPKTSNTDIVATEETTVEETIVETKEPTTINADVLEMIKSLQADMKKLQSENKKMKNEIKALKSENEEIKNTLKEMQSVDIVAPVNEVVEEVVVDTVKPTTNETDNILNILEIEQNKVEVQAPVEMAFGTTLHHFANETKTLSAVEEIKEETKTETLAFGRSLHHVFTEEEKSTKADEIEEVTVETNKIANLDDLIDNVEKKAKELSLDDITEEKQSQPIIKNTFVNNNENKILNDPFGLNSAI